MLVIDLGCGWLKYPTTFENPNLETNDAIIGVDVCHYNNDIVASALKTPFRNEIADLVVIREFIEHVDAVSLIREIWRILKPNGKIYITTPNSLYIFKVLRALYGQEANPYYGHIQTFSSPEIRNLLRRNGFINIKIVYQICISRVFSRNFILKIIKILITWLTDKLFSTMNRTIEATAIKDDKQKFITYV